MSKAIDFIKSKYVVLTRFYKILILSILFLMQIPFVHYSYGEYVKYALALGIFICAFDIFCNHGIRKLFDAVNTLLLVFALFYVATILLNRSTCLSENIKQLVYMVVFFWIFAMYNKYKMIDAINDMNVVSFVIVAESFCLSIISLSTFFLNIEEWYVYDGSKYYIGRLGNALVGLYNSNSCGAIAMVSLIASFFLLFKFVHSKKAVLFVVRLMVLLNVAIQILTLALSQSRGSLYAFVITMWTVLLMVVVKNARSKISNKLLKMVGITLLTLLIVCLLIIIRYNSNFFVFVNDEDANNKEKDSWIENVLESELVERFYETSAHLGAILLDEPYQNINNVEKNDAAISSFTTGRSLIWKVGFNSFLSHPIFGLTREGFVDDVSKEVNILMQTGRYEYTGVIEGGLHNMYLTILVSSGIVGFISIGAAMIIILINFLRVLFSKIKLDSNLLFSFAMVFAFLISELVENRILYQVTVFNAVFWIYFGYLHFFTKEALKEKSNEFSLNKTE